MSFRTLLFARLARTSVRGKLGYLIAITCGSGIVAAASALFAFQIFALRSSFRHDIAALSEIVAGNLPAPVAFNDVEAARDVLRTLDVRTEISGALVRTRDGARFAETGPALAPLTTPGSAPAVDFGLWMLQVSQPIQLRHETHGYLDIAADFRPTFVRAFGLYALVVLATGLVALGLALVVGRWMQSLIVAPVQQLADAAHQIGDRHDYTVRVPRHTDDELGLLTDAFNGMLDRIHVADQALRRANESLASEVAERQRAEARLLEASRLAGMAEIATGILHNVGNVLNSVNISAGLLRDQVTRNSHVGLLLQTADLLRAQGEDVGRFLAADPRGRLVAPFIIELADSFSLQGKELTREFDVLTSNIEHIKQIVAMQQRHAKSGGVLLSFEPTELVADALRIAQASITRHGIAVTTRAPAGTSPIVTDRHQVLQVLVNLVTNAIKAVKPQPAGQRQIALRLERSDSRISFVVEDNGVGIAAENLPRLFQHGFTTRRDGHGFGLHTGALIARSLGGSLRADSDGPGRGARFTLELPLASDPSSP